MTQPNPVVVLDFGSQYTQLIARRIRELQVYAVIVPCNIPFDDFVRMNPQALILSGGPSSVYDPESPVCDERVLKLNLPGARHLLWLAVDGVQAGWQGGAGGPARIRLCRA